MKSPKARRVTVITSYFNREQGLDESIRSVLNQTYHDFNFWVIDDCSTDATAKLLQNICHSNFQLIKNTRNVGIAKNFRHAIEICGSEFIAIHGAGDISFSKRIQKQVQYMDENPNCVAVGCLVEHELSDGTIRSVNFSSLNPNDVGIFSHGEVLMRTAAVKKCGNYRDLFYYAQDRDLWFRLQRYGYFARIPEILYRRRAFSDGVSVKPDKWTCQRVFSNCAKQAYRCSGDAGTDVIDRFHALAVLKQAPLPAFHQEVHAILRPLWKARRYQEAYNALRVVPAGMLSFKMIALLLFLRIFVDLRHKQSSDPFPGLSFKE